MYRKQFKVKKDFIKINRLVLLILLTIYFSIPLYSQVGIGTEHLGTSSILELNSENKALLLPRVENKDLVQKPEEGMLIYNKKNKCFQLYSNGVWEGLNTCVTANVEDSKWLGYKDLPGKYNINSIPVSITHNGGTEEDSEDSVCDLKLKFYSFHIGNTGSIVFKFSRPVTNIKFRIKMYKNTPVIVTSNNKTTQVLSLFGPSTCLSNIIIEDNVVKKDPGQGGHAYLGYDLNVGGEAFTELTIEFPGQYNYPNQLLFSLQDATAY